jgi:hypothetical protein
MGVSSLAAPALGFEVKAPTASGTTGDGTSSPEDEVAD